MDTSNSIQFLAFVVLVVGLTVGGYATRRPILVFSSSVFWVLFGIFCYNRSVYEWDIYDAMFFFSMAMCIATAIEGAMMREKQGDMPTDEDIERGDAADGDLDTLRSRLHRRAINSHRKRAYQRLISRMRRGE